MFTLTKQIFKRLLLVLLCITLQSCVDQYQELEVHFFAGRNLEVCQAAVKGYATPKLQPKILAFMKQYGNRTVTRAYDKGIKELNTEKETSLLYFQDLVDVLKDMDQLNFPISSLETILKKSEERLETIERSYVTNELSLGSMAYKNNNYTEAIDHFTSYLKHHPEDDTTRNLLKLARQKNKKHIIVTPFYTESQTIPNALENEIRALFNKTPIEHNILKGTPRIKGLNISEQLSVALIQHFQKKDNAYVSASLKENPNVSKNITIRGIIEATDHDTEFTPQRLQKTDTLRYEYDNNGLRKWDTTYFEYEILTNSYSISYFCIVQVLMNGKVKSEFELEKVTESAQSYRTGNTYWDKPFGEIYQVQYPTAYQQLPDYKFPIDKEATIRRSVDELASAITEKVLEKISAY